MAILGDGKAKGIFIIFLAICLMGCGFFQLGCHLRSDNQAAFAAEEAVQVIQKTIPQQVIPAKQFHPELLMQEEVPKTLDAVPYYVLNPEMEMPEQNIDGIGYIGVLEIPALQLELPVASQWHETTAQKAPCRYVGSAYTKDLIICAHNYRSHFGNLSDLPVGTSVFLTDTEGNCFEYWVEDFEIMDGTAIDQMKQGDWDLTLFTCTLGGRSRFAVRCRQVIQQ